MTITAAPLGKKLTGLQSTLKKHLKMNKKIKQELVRFMLLLCFFRWLCISTVSNIMKLLTRSDSQALLTIGRRYVKIKLQI